MSLKSVFLFFTLGFWMVTSALAGKASLSKNTQSKLKFVEVKQTELEKIKGFNLSTSLSSRTDLADEKPERSYKHGLGVRLGYDFDDLSISAGTSYSYISMNTDVVEQKYMNDGISDSTIDVSFLKHFSVTGTLPTSQATQFEGLKGSVTLGAGYKHELGIPSVSLSHGLKYDYLFNTFIYSPISNKPTYEMALAYSLVLSAEVFSEFSIGMGFDAQTSKLNDGSVELGSNVNSSFAVSTGYKFEKLSIGLSYGSGNFFDDKFQNNWFLNQYQQVITLRLGYKWL